MNNDPPDSEQHPIDSLANQFTTECREGKNPSIEDYVKRHPEMETEIRKLFPMISMIESLGQQEQVARKDLQKKARFQYLRQTIEQIGDYDVIRQIGRGGMGVVYEAIQRSLKRRVAIKVLPSFELEGDASTALQRFQRESQATASLHHTNIVPIFDVGQQDGLYFYVMQFIDGSSLDCIVDVFKNNRFDDFSLDKFGSQFQIDDILRRLKSEADQLSTPAQADLPSTNNTHLKTTRVVPETKVEFLTVGNGNSNANDNYWNYIAGLGIQIANALAYAHEQGVVHRDVKPSNLLLDLQGIVWIADFGLAKDNQNPNLTRTGDILGTLQYMAPEQLHGDGDERSDLYGLGATLYELLSLQPLVDQRPLDDMVRQISARTSAPGLRKINHHIPRDLETIVMKSVAHNPAKRYASAKEMSSDLQRFLDQRPIAARRTTRTEKAWRWCRRNPAIASLSLTIAVLLVLVTTSLTVGYFSEAALRQQTEQMLDISLSALGKVYERLAPERVVAPTDLILEDSEGNLILTNDPVLSRESAAVLLDLLPAYNRLAKQSTNKFQYRKDAAEATARAGQIQFRIGDPLAAIETFELAIRKYKNMSSLDRDVDYEIAKLYNELGAVKSQLSYETETARECYLAALALLEPVEFADVTSDNIKRKFELARSFYNLGFRRRMTVGMPPPPRVKTGPFRRPPPPHDAPPPPHRSSKEQRAFLNRAINILQDLINTGSKIPEYRFLLALCLREKAGRPDSQDMAKSRKLLAEIVEQYPDVADYLYEFCQTNGSINLHEYRGQIDGEVESRLRVALDFAERLDSKHPEIPRYLHLLAVLNHKLSEVLMRDERARQIMSPAVVEETIQLAMRAIELQTVCISRNPGQQTFELGLARMEESLGIIYRDAGYPGMGLPRLEKAIQIATEILDNPSDEFFKKSAERALNLYYRRLAQINREVGNDDEAEVMEMLANEFGPKISNSDSQ